MTTTTSPQFIVTFTGEKEDADNVTIGFTMAWKAAAVQGLRTEIILLSKSTRLAQRGYAEQIAVGEPFKPLGELLDLFLEAGGTIKVCGNCMHYNKVDETTLIPEAEVVQSEYVIDALMNAQSSLQMN